MDYVNQAFIKTKWYEWYENVNNSVIYLRMN